ncbi:uncharacterized protein [Periplaneta americana]|uniref:uncharacterized protein isoform X2 n=1 Tax=Periplaneta americana TaxID=6978 RepID=UPI0037E7F0A8
MSTVNKDSTSKKKPRLPTGWAVYPSKTYPNRVYYFNSFTGCTTWDKPPVGCDDEEDSDESSDVRRRSSDNSDIESRAASSSSSLRHTTSESEKKPDSTVSSERNKTMRNGINDNVRVNKKTPSTSSLFDVKDLCQNKVDNHGEKRQWKEGSLTGSKTNLENSPLKKLKLNFASSSDTSEKRTDSDSDVRNQTDLLLRLGGDASSGSPKKSCVELPEDDLRHILKAKRNRKHKKSVEVPKSEAQETSPANSGLAARRLSDLQSKLAEERRKREKCEVGEEVNESEQSAWSLRIESRTSWTNYNDKQSSQSSRSSQSSQTATLAKVGHEVNRPQLSSPSPKAELRISEKNCGVSPLFQGKYPLLVLILLPCLRSKIVLFYGHQNYDQS